MKTDTRRLVILALLTAIIIVMSFTPLGYLRLPIAEITLLMVPVIIGAIILGPGAGAFLGLVFGISSFIIGMSGTSPLSVLPYLHPQILNIPLFFILCIPTRVLAGFIPGVIFKLMYKKRQNIVPFIVASLSGALSNTVLFVGFLVLAFGRSDFVSSFAPNVWGIIWAIVGLNGLIEAAACTILGTIIGRVLYRFAKKA